ncbi:MAG: 4Fe-4S dicluster domain-containing protein [Deltaproteobacteria bacterium]|nr:MAG: 4Fe-4S dicluster domain-containing protein [Deltaproteobacteria bacterium]
MSLFSIDQKKCKRDGICAAECPAQIIVQADKKSFPSLLLHGEEFCINCGHCVAVCPHDAITLSTMPLAACPPIERNILPKADALKQLLLARRSIRQYKKTPVSNKLLTELIDTARYAPTGSNKQQVSWMVFQKPEDVHKLAAQVIDFMKMMLPVTTDEATVRRFQRIVNAWDNGRDRIMRGAPHLIVVHSPSDLSFPAADCAIALTYLELYASTKGLGTCWAGYFTAAAGLHEPLIQVLNLPAGHLCFGAVMLGYPQYRYHRIPTRNEPLITWR